MLPKKISYKATLANQKLDDYQEKTTIARSPERELWYSSNSVCFEIVKALRFKELQIIGGGISVRWLNCFKLDTYKSIKKYMKFDSRFCSMYMSLDYYNRIPFMSYNLAVRKEESEQWALDRRSQVKGMDFGLDLDCKNGTWRDAIRDAREIQLLFNAYNVRFAFWCSGQHGFHFIVPFEDMPQEIKDLQYEKLIAFYKRGAEIIAKRIKSVDLSIYMPTRVLKCPYSIEKGGNVIFPLDEGSFMDLVKGDLKLNKPIEILKNYEIRNRGIYLQGKPDGIKDFFENWEGF